MGKSLKLSHHQRALTIITQPWFKAKWQSIIELSEAAYGLFTEFRHTVGGSKERRSLLIHRESRRGALALQVPLVLRNPLHVLWLLHQLQRSSSKILPCQAERKMYPSTWDFPPEERSQFLTENCLSISTWRLHQAERAEIFPKPLPPYPPFLLGLSRVGLQMAFWKQAQLRL